MKQKVTATVRSQRMLAEGIMELVLETELAAEAHAGQFIGLYTADASRLLPRPISICAHTDRTLRLVYRIAGGGTAQFALYGPGMVMEVLGILGNGYPLAPAAGKRALLMGGGIGIPPLYQLACDLSTTAAEVTVILGYRDAQLFLAEDFRGIGGVRVGIATQDGSVGVPGTVLDAAGEEPSPDVIYACGPTPMLRAIQGWAAEREIPAWLSLEERMACGIGACLGCVCQTAEEDPHSHVRNARVCTEGPVFAASEVVL